MLKRLQRQAPSWLEQLPQLPDAVMESLQQSRELGQRSNLQHERLDELQQQRDGGGRRRGYRTAAIVALVFAAISATPGGLLQLGDIPATAWALAGLALVLFWRADNRG